VAQELVAMGFTKVYALKGGWNDWYKAEFPVEKK
jgi:rhodanese-related sulfurtransferase